MSDAIYIGGHSLGGSDAYLYAMSRIARGLRVDGIIALAPARPGNVDVGRILRSVQIDVRAIGNRGDPITDKPFDLSTVGEEYEQPFPLEIIDEVPPPGSDFLFGRHMVELYIDGCDHLHQGNGPFPLSWAAREIARLYDDADGWDWINPVDGLYWVMKRHHSGARFLIRRGSHTRLDWFREDLDAIEVPLHGAKVCRGFWSGVGPVESELDKVLA